MRRTFLVFVLMSAGLLALPASAYACRCITWESSVRDRVGLHFKGVSRAIFEATVASEWSLGAVTLVFLRDIKGWRGTPRHVIRVGPRNGCSSLLEVGRRYLIDGSADLLGTLATNVCSLTSRIEDAGETITVLESLSDRSRKNP